MQNVRHRPPTPHSTLALLLAVLLSFIVLSRQAAPAAAVTAPTLDLNGEPAGINFETTFSEDEGAKPIISTTGLTIAYADVSLSRMADVLDTAGKGSQVAPAVSEYCHTPLLDTASMIAMPSSASLSTSVMRF